MAGENLKISIVGTLNISSTVTEINSKLKEVEKKIDKIKIQVDVGQQANTALNNLNQQIRNLNTNAGNVHRNAQNISSQLNNVGSSAHQASVHVQTFGSMLSQAFEKFPIWMLASTAFFLPIKALKDMTQRLIEIDTQMTEIRRVMDEPDYKFVDMLQNAVDTSDQLSSKLTDVLNIMGGFGRMGGFNDAQLIDMTKTAQVFQNISDLDANGAVDTLTSAMLNFNIQAKDSISIADKLNEVDNHYAISEVA
jgi:methyl-accepting chemotaxis protein